MRLDGKIALVTGSGSGIGQAIAYGFAAEGADIAVNDIELSRAVETCKIIQDKYGRKAIPVVADISDESAIDNMVNLTLKEFKKIDILVNNAGNADQVKTPTIDQVTSVFDRVLAVHLRGTYLCCRIIGRHMVKQNSGVIINISSVHGIAPMTKRTAYGPAKAGIINLTQQLAVEWSPYNIRVNAIIPGFIRTPLVEEAFKVGRLIEDDIVKPIAMKRLGKSEEIGSVALFLASNDSSYVTGTTILVDGGWFANRG